MGATDVLIISGVVVAGALIAYFVMSGGGIKGLAQTGVDVMKQMSPIGMASSAYDLTKKIGKDLKVADGAKAVGKSIGSTTSKIGKSVNKTNKAIAKPFKKIHF